MAAGDTQITITGNLVDDPELRFTPAGQAVAVTPGEEIIIVIVSPAVIVPPIPSEPTASEVRLYALV